MSKIEEIWNKHSDPTTEQMFWWQFEKAAEELLKLQREICKQAYLKNQYQRYTDIQIAILNAKLEGE